jgi:hypothetical protein
VPLVTVIGGYGIFGGRIAAALARDPDCEVRIVGRNQARGQKFADQIGASFLRADLHSADGLRRAIEQSTLVVHSAGPFQGQDYRVAEKCIEQGVHYLDLADGREFVGQIGQLDEAAKKQGVLVLSGVSSTPAVTSAMADVLAPEFSQIHRIETALSPGNQNPRGASTIAAVLSYLGREFKMWTDNGWRSCSGWGDRQIRLFPGKIGERRTYNCDVPDLELLPARYNSRSVRFQAGLELNIMNRLISFLRWLKLNFKLELVDRAGWFLRFSMLLFPFGSKNGGLALWMYGRDHDGRDIERRMAIVTADDGPATPSSAAILMTRKILAGKVEQRGALPCMGLLKMEEFMDHLNPLGIWCVRGNEEGWSAQQPVDNPSLCL